MWRKREKTGETEKENQGNLASAHQTISPNIWCRFERARMCVCVCALAYQTMCRCGACAFKHLCGCMYTLFAAGTLRFPETRRGEQQVDEHRLLAKQSISPSHRPHHTSQTHPSLLTQWRVSFIKQDLARASHVCVGVHSVVCIHICVCI